MFAKVCVCGVLRCLLHCLCGDDFACLWYLCWLYGVRIGVGCMWLCCLGWWIWVYAFANWLVLLDGCAT